MLASYLDSTNLKPDATGGQIRELCDEAFNLGMAAVCVNPFRVPEASQWLKGTRVKVCTVIGFPLGACGLNAKTGEARQALKQGARELDMVVNIGAIMDGNYQAAKKEIDQLADLKLDFSFILKVIVETALLNRDQLAHLTALVSDSKADYIKTSTGMAARGVSLEDLEVIKRHRRPGLKVKASGGVRELHWAMQLLAAGADRLGSSNAGALVRDFQAGDMNGSFNVHSLKQPKDPRPVNRRIKRPEQ